MRRFEAIRLIMDLISDEIVVCNIGHPSQELYLLKDRPRNFYMLGSMGLASSIALGLALSTGKKVVAIEGDGAILMNLGSLATIGATSPKNYTLIIIDNGAHGSTGFQETFAAKSADLNGVAKACGIANSIKVSGEDSIRSAVKEALETDDGPSCIVAKVEKGMPDNIQPISLTSDAIRDRFIESIC